MRWNGFRRLAARRRFSIMISGLTALVISAGLSWIRLPMPRIQDEFSYLLAADTFAHGRASNPTHRHWVHFETYHVLQTPRYVSKYPPAQGLFLAIGQRLTGEPIVGAWLAVSLGAAAVCWMLQGWTRPRWALLGGLLTGAHHGIHGGIYGWAAYFAWSQSYWGGGPALIGGALVLGAMPRLIREPRRVDSLWLGLGLVLLANSRPFEGLLVSLPVLVVLVIRCPRFRVVVPPLLAVLIPAAVAMAALNQSVTGSVFRLPYALYEATYNPAPIFSWGTKPSPPRFYRHEMMSRFFNGWCVEQWASQRTWSGWWSYHCDRLEWLRAFFIGPLLLPLAMFPWVVRNRMNRFAAAVCGLVVGVHFLTFGIQPHYAAPAFCAYMLIVVEGMRRLALVRVGSTRFGLALVRFTLFLVVLNLADVAFTRLVAPLGWEDDRGRIESTLKRQGGRHLIIVRYAPHHEELDGWIANGADIDHSPIVWAREMDSAMMRSLLRDFADRRFWLMEPDAKPPRLSVYRLEP